MAEKAIFQSTTNKAGRIAMAMAVGFWCAFGAVSLVNELGLAFIDGYVKLEFWKLCVVGACGAFMGFLDAKESDN